MPILRIRLDVAEQIKRKTQHICYVLNVMFGTDYSNVPQRSPSLLDLRSHTAVQHNVSKKGNTPRVNLY